MIKPIHASEYSGDTATTACFTGHRPEGIPFDVTSPEGHRFLLECIFSRISAEYEKGIKTFITGMAAGIDLIAGEAVIRLKTLHDDVRLICAIPNLSPEEFTAEKRGYPIYHTLAEAADGIVYFYEEYNIDQFHARNRFMVDNSSVVLAYMTNVQKGGTYYTYKYAQKKDKRIIKSDLNRMKEDFILFQLGILQPEDLLSC